MCYSEIKDTACALCNATISTEKLKHKCFDMMKSDKKYGKCGRKDGPYNTMVKQGICKGCKMYPNEKKRGGK
ncbi:hypothetical protein SAMD00023353_0202980 [Rosellinia necatrix]|uniref:Uncharacterized protein n=1 Tax=Rosellinia necatrix TaxID=77044 RepID=A0A1S8A4Y8_ROSNE|nr:hypothetical protein SAMD00023353_0202980 [Rosellinia necatrix]